MIKLYHKTIKKGYKRGRGGPSGGALGTPVGLPADASRHQQELIQCLR